MTKTKTYKWDILDHLRNEDEISAYLEAAFDDGDPDLIIAALGDVARAKGMTELARNTGLSREGLYKSLSGKSDPSFRTIQKVLSAYNMKLTANPAP